MKTAFYWLCFIGPLLLAMLVITHGDWRSLLQVLALLAAGMAGFGVTFYGLMKLMWK